MLEKYKELCSKVSWTMTKLMTPFRRGILIKSFDLLLCVRMQTDVATMENGMEVPQKANNRVAIWSSNPTPGHIPRQNYNSKRYMHSYVHSGTMALVHTME